MSSLKSFIDGMVKTLRLHVLGLFASVCLTQHTVESVKTHASIVTTVPYFVAWGGVAKPACVGILAFYAFF